MITIIDYGMGNLGSIRNMIKKIGGESIITNDINEIKKAEKLILPGVGRFDAGMNNLKEMNLIELLNDKVLKEKTPILGICLGMQLLTNYSEEGNVGGLGWIDAKTIKFNSEDKNFKIPHMGWNEIKVINESPIVRELENESRFYFVHSYYVKCNNEKNRIAIADYGNDFDCIIQNGTILGTQFHPEKSHKFGMKLMKNFMELI